MLELQQMKYNNTIIEYYKLQNEKLKLEIEILKNKLKVMENEM